MEVAVCFTDGWGSSVPLNSSLAGSSKPCRGGGEVKCIACVVCHMTYSFYYVYPVDVMATAGGQHHMHYGALTKNIYFKRSHITC